MNIEELKQYVIEQNLISIDDLLLLNEKEHIFQCAIWSKSTNNVIEILENAKKHNHITFLNEVTEEYVSYNASRHLSVLKERIFKFMISNCKEILLNYLVSYDNYGKKLYDKSYYIFNELIHEYVNNIEFDVFVRWFNENKNINDKVEVYNVIMKYTKSRGNYILFGLQNKNIIEIKNVSKHICDFLNNKIMVKDINIFNEIWRELQTFNFDIFECDTKISDNMKLDIFKNTKIILCDETYNKLNCRKYIMLKTIIKFKKSKLPKYIILKIASYLFMKN